MIDPVIGLFAGDVHASEGEMSVFEVASGIRFDNGGAACAVPVDSAAGFQYALAVAVILF
jgi:hypothetical protein